MSRFLAAAAAFLLSLPLATAAEEAPQAPAASAPAATPAPAPADEIIGEVVQIPTGISIAYGKGKLVGPRASLHESSKGTWKGNLRDWDGVLDVTDTRISGQNMNIVVERDGKDFVAQGTWNGKRVRIAFSAGELAVRIDTRYYEMKRVSQDLFATQPVGPALRLKGDATSASPAYPQFILAAMGVF